MNIKDYREKELKIYVIANIIVILYLSDILNVGELVSENNYMKLIISILNSSLFSGIIYSLCIVFDSLIPSKIKDYFVYWWWHKPGETIFSRMYNNKIDDRFTSEDAKEKYSDIFNGLQSIKDKIKKKEYENSKWYGIYRLHEEEMKVLIAQRDFLLCRDMALVSMATLAIYIIFASILDFLTVKVSPIIYLVLMYLITMLAANVKGKRFANTVISCDLHSKDGKK